MEAVDQQSDIIIDCEVRITPELGGPDAAAIRVLRMDSDVQCILIPSNLHHRSFRTRRTLGRFLLPELPYGVSRLPEGLAQSTIQLYSAGDRGSRQTLLGYSEARPCETGEKNEEASSSRWRASLDHR